VPEAHLLVKGLTKAADEVLMSCAQSTCCSNQEKRACGSSKSWTLGPSVCLLRCTWEGCPVAQCLPFVILSNTVKASKSGLLAMPCLAGCCSFQMHVVLMNAANIRCEGKQLTCWLAGCTQSDQERSGVVATWTCRHNSTSWC